MLTDDERREVARRLRELRSGWSSGECYYTIINALGLPDTSGEDGGAELYAHIADLIEPSEPEVKYVAEVKVDGWRLEQLAHDAAVELTGIDRNALLELADGLQFVQLTGRTYYENVGNLIDAMDEAAHRIREALGVHDA